MAIGMVISVLVEALLLGGGGEGGGDTAHNPPTKDEKVLKEWIKNNLKIRHESSRSIAWNHWSDSRLDPQ